MDITLCSSNKCVRKTCKRKSILSIEPWQSYSDFWKEQKIHKPQDCKYYINEKRGLK